MSRDTRHKRTVFDTGTQGLQLSPTALRPGRHPLGLKPTDVHVDPLKPNLLDLLHGDFVLASRLLAAQTVSAGFAAILLQAFSSVVLLLVVLSLFDLALVALAVQFGQRIQEKR